MVGAEEKNNIEKGAGNIGVGGGGGGMNWEIGIDMYTLICIKWMTNKNLLYKKINKIKFKKTIWFEEIYSAYIPG